MDFKHDLMQSLANGIYEAQYQIYAGIWTVRHSRTSSLLPNTKAENSVPVRADRKTILQILRSLSTMFLHCLLKPSKNPVLS